jgi:hypothetical protein
MAGAAAPPGEWHAIGCREPGAIKRALDGRIALRGDDTMHRDAADVFAPTFFAPFLKCRDSGAQICGVNFHAKNIYAIFSQGFGHDFNIFRAGSGWTIGIVLLSTRGGPAFLVISAQRIFHSLNKVLCQSSYASVISLNLASVSNFYYVCKEVLEWATPKHHDKAF